MSYSEEQGKEIRLERGNCIEKLNDLMLDFLTHPYQTDRGKEFGQHGVGRRIKSIIFSLEEVFEIVPPEAVRPTTREITHACALVHSFMINVFGVLENLAHIWVQEHQITDESGLILKPNHIGFGSKHKAFRKSLSSEVRTEIRSMDLWYEYLCNYRHALAHRIPPYLVPRTMGPTDADLWKKIEQQKFPALKDHDWEEHERLMNEQDRLGRYDPLMTHSFEEGAKPVFYHGQMINDGLTVHKIGGCFLRNLPA